MQHHGFERMAGIGFARTVEQRHQTGIDRIDLARVNLLATHRIAGQGDAVQQKGIFQMRQHLVQGVLADWHPARAQVGMELVDAERPCCIAQQLLHQPAQHLRLAQVVPLQHVAQQHHVHITVQQRLACAYIQPLGLGETALSQVTKQVVLQLRMTGAGEAIGRLLWLTPGMAKRLAKPERGHHCFQRAASHTGCHLA